MYDGMSRRVLCVDDESEALDATTTHLERRGEAVETVAATGASEAMAMLSELSIDCVVSDHDMPGETGLDLLRSVRETDPDLPFVLFTARGSESVAMEAISAGVTDYLRKGDADQYELLANRVEDAVDQYRVERRLHETNHGLTVLTESAIDLAEADRPSAVLDRTLDVAEEILDVDALGLYELVDGRFEPRTDRSFRPADGPMAADEGLIGTVYDSGEPALVDDVADSEVAEPASDSLRSIVSVPVEGFGVFQGVSQRPGAFGERDMELAELLLSHTEQALERLDYERDLRETNERLQAILDNTTAVVYVKDLDGRYTLVNDRYLDVLDMERADVLGKTDFEMQEPEYARAVRRNDEEAIQQGGPVEVEERAHRGGQERVYFSVKVPIFDDDGRPRAVCGISSDITELKERERELERQNERLDQFASVVSHDLRNPLGVARGYLELALADQDDDRLTEVASALDRMEDIIEDLLALAQDGEEIGETEAVAVADAARDAWANVATGEATLCVEGDRTVSADRTRLLQVFENCFRNSVEHGSTCPGSHAPQDSVDHAGDSLTVRVGTTVDGFYVEDDGSGFPEGATERALRPGYSTSEAGTGFGLAIVDSIAQAHGWDVWLTGGDDGGARVELATD